MSAKASFLGLLGKGWFTQDFDTLASQLHRLTSPALVHRMNRMTRHDQCMNAIITTIPGMVG
jgi:hypothetical protein